jgi:hypothetical protein
MDTIIAYRVTYGKKSTPLKDREYTANAWGSPVGTKAEWNKWAKKLKKKIVFKETPMKRIFVEEK